MENDIILLNLIALIDIFEPKWASLTLSNMYHMITPNPKYSFEYHEKRTKTIEMPKYIFFREEFREKHWGIRSKVPLRAPKSSFLTEERQPGASDGRTDG